MSDNGKAKDLLDQLQRGESVDLLELEEQDGPEIVLPNRRKVRIRLFDGAHYQLYERVHRNPTDKDAETLIRFAVPDITAEELGSLSPLMALFIGKAAARQADAMLWLLRKNAARPVLPQPAPAGPSQLPRSPRKTKSSTPSRGSPSPSAAKGRAAGGP